VKVEIIGYVNKHKNIIYKEEEVNFMEEVERIKEEVERMKEKEKEIKIFIDIGNYGLQIQNKIQHKQNEIEHLIGRKKKKLIYRGNRKEREDNEGI
jgi:pyridoxine 5'-phosphate synthase PdxJ